MLSEKRIVVFNPGGLVKWFKPEEFGKISKTRNPIIASLLAKTIFVEKMGTGINRIRKAMEALYLPVPEFKFYEHSFYTTLVDKTILKIPGKDLQKDLEKLSANQRKIITEIRKNQYITQKELSQIIGINEKNIRNNIRKLKDFGIIKRVGPDKGGHWEVIKRN